MTEACPACLAGPMEDEDVRYLRLQGSIVLPGGGTIGAEHVVPCPLCRPRPWHEGGEPVKPLWDALIRAYGKEL